MNKECGELKQICPMSVFWKIGSINPARNDWMSKIFTILECDSSFCFVVEPNDMPKESAQLQLCETINSKRNTFLLHIVLKYSHTNKTLLRKPKKPRKDGTWFIYDLGTIITSKLVEIMCIFFPVETVAEVADKNTGQQKGSSKKRKSQELCSETVERKVLKTTGLEMLCGNLKEAFLSGEDCDVIVKVGDQEYHAHRVILRYRSPVFYSMLKHNMVEKNEGVINITDCDPYIFRDFLLYLYTGKVEGMSKSNVFELYHISDKYNLDELKIECVDFLLANLAIDIFCDAVVLATRYLEQDVLKHATEFFMANAKAIVVTVEWQNFIKEFPIQANEMIIKLLHNVRMVRLKLNTSSMSNEKDIINIG